jgi:hypothetical protein
MAEQGFFHAYGVYKNSTVVRSAYPESRFTRLRNLEIRARELFLGAEHYSVDMDLYNLEVRFGRVDLREKLKFGLTTVSTPSANGSAWFIRNNETIKILIFASHENDIDNLDDIKQNKRHHYTIKPLIYEWRRPGITKAIFNPGNAVVSAQCRAYMLLALCSIGMAFSPDTRKVVVRHSPTPEGQSRNPRVEDSNTPEFRVVVIDMNKPKVVNTSSGSRPGNGGGWQQAEHMRREHKRVYRDADGKVRKEVIVRAYRAGSKTAAVPVVKVIIPARSKAPSALNVRGMTPAYMAAQRMPGVSLEKRAP